MSDDQNKTEKPTPFKLKEAKNKGQVSKSQELNSIITLVVFTVLAYVFWQQTMSQFAHLATRFVRLSADAGETPAVLASLLGEICWLAIGLIAPFFAVLMLSGILANVVQTGLVLTAFPLQPDFSKLSPAKSLKRIFSKKTLFEFFKSSLKIVMFAVLL
ncbi:MAG: flagellar biosynthetic protein FlhB [Phenylobacterium sp.]